MSFKIASAHVEVDARGIGKVERDLLGLKATMGGVGKQLLALGAGFTGLFGFAGAGATAGALGTWGVRLSAQSETARVGFETLLGSAEAAHKVLADLNSFAASTPFQLPELVSAGRSLLAFGVAAEDLLPTLRAIGDVSSGIGAPIGEIAEIFGKARVQGRLFAEDINQLTGRGIPVIGELAKQFGVAESEVRKLVETGQVNFGHLEKAFQALTSEGGKFANLMEKTSQTLEGRFSTLTDEIGALAKEFGDKLNPALKEAIDLASQGVQHLRGPEAQAPGGKPIEDTFGLNSSTLKKRNAEIFSEIMRERENAQSDSALSPRWWLESWEETEARQQGAVERIKALLAESEQIAAELDRRNIDTRYDKVPGALAGLAGDGAGALGGIAANFGRDAMRNLSSALIGGVEGFGDIERGIKNQIALRKDSDQIRNEMATPAEAFEAKLKELQRLASGGALTQGEHGRAIAHAEREALEAMDRDAPEEQDDRAERFSSMKELAGAIQQSLANSQAEAEKERKEQARHQENQNVLHQIRDKIGGAVFAQ